MFWEYGKYGIFTAVCWLRFWAVNDFLSAIVLLEEIYIYAVKIQDKIYFLPIPFAKCYTSTD